MTLFSKISLSSFSSTFLHKRHINTEREIVTTYDPKSLLAPPFPPPRAIVDIETSEAVRGLFLRSGGSLMATEMVLPSISRPSVFTSACAADVCKIQTHKIKSLKK